MQEVTQPNPKPHRARNKRKREDNFLSGRTELTSNETWETYLQRQDILRSEMDVKRREREAALLFDQLLWAVPNDSEVLLLQLMVHVKLDIGLGLLVMAPEIVEFWRETLRAQFNARLGIQDVTMKSGFSAVFPLCANQYCRPGASEKTTPDQSLATRRGPGGFPPGRRCRHTDERGHR